MTVAEPLFGSLLPDIITSPPGGISRHLAKRLRSVESRNITYFDVGWPIFWKEASGSNVRDVDHNLYIDLSGAFGVALIGHAHPRVVHALQAQGEELIHGMGDIHPPVRKVELIERLCRIVPWVDAQAVLTTTGSEAVEVALKTARIATGKPGIVAFRGGYHGLTMGALAVTDRAHFRSYFEDQLYKGVSFAPFPECNDVSRVTADETLGLLRAAFQQGAPNGDPIGAVIVEPVQGRAGVRIPPDGFMAALSDVAMEEGAMVIADEIFTGLGRCGSMLASERLGLRPDIVCIGKVFGGGLPLSACLSSQSVLSAWPENDGEAIHTNTFLGNPLSCATALAVLDIVEHLDVPERAEVLGSQLLSELQDSLRGAERVSEVRGRGLMIGIELVTDDGSPWKGGALRVAEAALAQGLIILPAGEHGHVVELTPSAFLTEDQATHSLVVLSSIIQKIH